MITGEIINANIICPGKFALLLQIRNNSCDKIAASNVNI